MKKRIVLISVGLMMFTGCATLFSGTDENIMVNSKPQGATIEIGGVVKGFTPATINIKRSAKDKEVVLKLDGYTDKTFVLGKSFNIVSILNIASVPGYIIDYVTGAMFKFDPTSYSMELEAMTSYNIEDLPIDELGRILVPNVNEAFVVIDTEADLKIIFDN